MMFKAPGYESATAELVYATLKALTPDDFTYEELRDIFIRFSGGYPKILLKEDMYIELIKWFERRIILPETD